MILIRHKLDGCVAKVDHAKVGVIDLWKIGLVASDPCIDNAVFQQRERSIHPKVVPDPVLPAFGGGLGQCWSRPECGFESQVFALVSESVELMNFAFEIEKRCIAFD